MGLTGYYRKFIKGYVQLAYLFTQMLKKNNFSSTPMAEEAFERLKVTMSSKPVLALPDFTKEFVV